MHTNVSEGGKVRCGVLRLYPLRGGLDEAAGPTKLSLNDRKKTIMCQAVIHFDLVRDDWI